MDSFCCILLLLYLTHSTFVQLDKIDFFDVNDAASFPFKYHRTKRFSTLPKESNSNRSVHNCKEDSCKNDTRPTNTTNSNSSSTNAILKVSFGTTERSLQALIKEAEEQDDSSKTKLSRNRRTIITLSTIAAAGGLSIVSIILMGLRVIRWFFGFGWDNANSNTVVTGMFGFVTSFINVFARLFGIKLDVNQIRNGVNVTENSMYTNYLIAGMNGNADASGMYPMYSNVHSNYHTLGQSSNVQSIPGQFKYPFISAQSSDTNLFSGQSTLNMNSKQVLQEQTGYLTGSFMKPVQYLKTESMDSPVYEESGGLSSVDISNAIIVTNSVSKELSNGNIVIEFVHPITNKVIQIPRDGNTEYVNPDSNQVFIVYVDSSGRIMLVLKVFYVTQTRTENNNYNVLISSGNSAAEEP